MRLAEGVLRSQNNLLERLHASIWFYMFSSLHHYSSISLYMPSIGLILLLPLGKIRTISFSVESDGYTPVGETVGDIRSWRYQNLLAIKVDCWRFFFAVGDQDGLLAIKVDCWRFFFVVGDQDGLLAIKVDCWR